MRSRKAERSEVAAAAALILSLGLDDLQRARVQLRLKTLPISAVLLGRSYGSESPMENDPASHRLHPRPAPAGPPQRLDPASPAHVHRRAGRLRLGVARCAAVGMTPRSAYRLMDAAGADSFAAAWDGRSRAASSASAPARSSGRCTARRSPCSGAANWSGRAAPQRPAGHRLARRAGNRGIDDYRRSAVSRRAYRQDLAARDRRQGRSAKPIISASSTKCSNAPSPSANPGSGACNACAERSRSRSKSMTL